MSAPSWPSWESPTAPRPPCWPSGTPAAETVRGGLAGYTPEQSEHAVSSTWYRWRERSRMTAEVLRLRGVGVRHDKSMLLRDVDWTAHSDESWVVIGPNGAGKTTLLQVAATLITPTHGTVEVLGERVDDADLTDLRSRIGMSSSAIAEQVPQNEKVIDLGLTAAYGILS